MFPHVHTPQTPVGKDQAEKFGQYNPSLFNATGPLQESWLLWQRWFRVYSKLLEVFMFQVLSMQKKALWHSPSEFSSPCHFTGAVPRWQITQTTEKALVCCRYGGVDIVDWIMYCLHILHHVIGFCHHICHDLKTCYSCFSPVRDGHTVQHMLLQVNPNQRNPLRLERGLFEFARLCLYHWVLPGCPKMVTLNCQRSLFSRKLLPC